MLLKYILSITDFPQRLDILLAAAVLFFLIESIPAGMNIAQIVVVIM